MWRVLHCSTCHRRKLALQVLGHEPERNMTEEAIQPLSKSSRSMSALQCKRAGTPGADLKYTHNITQDTTQQGEREPHIPLNTHAHTQDTLEVKLHSLVTHIEATRLVYTAHSTYMSFPPPRSPLCAARSPSLPHPPKHQHQSQRKEEYKTS